MKLAVPESFSREVPEGSKAPRVYGKRNPNAVIEARQRRLYRRQLDGLPARQLILDHADRESVSEKTAWMDWRVVNEWNSKDFEAERATMVSRLQNMRMRAIEKALRKGQLSSAAMMMDSLGKVLNESESDVTISAPNLSIKIEQNAPEDDKKEA